MFRLLDVYDIMPLWFFSGGIIELHWINEDTGDEVLTYGEIEIKPL